MPDDTHWLFEDEERDDPAMVDRRDEAMLDGSAFEAERTLRDAVDALPTSRAPDRDLWPSIRARLEPRSGQGASETAPGVLPFRRGTGTGPRTFAWRALAAMLWMGLGAALTWWALGGQATLDPDGPDMEDGYALASYAPDAPDRSLDASFLRAKEELWLRAYERRGDLDPATWDLVQQNLQILDRAIEDLRAALDDDPGNHQLEDRLRHSHQRSLDLLRSLADAHDEV